MQRTKIYYQAVAVTIQPYVIHARIARLIHYAVDHKNEDHNQVDQLFVAVTCVTQDKLIHSTEIICCKKSTSIHLN